MRVTSRQCLLHSKSLSLEIPVVRSMWLGVWILATFLSQPRSQFSVSVLWVLQGDDSVESKLFLTSLQTCINALQSGCVFFFDFSILPKNTTNFKRLPEVYLIPASSSFVDPRCLSKLTEYLIKETWVQLSRDLR